jgi:hypothetical protein
MSVQEDGLKALELLKELLELKALENDLYAEIIIDYDVHDDWERRNENLYADAKELVRRHRKRSQEGLNYSVWRQDDNGHKFLVSSRLAREEAEHLAEEMELRGHKQMYYVEED